MNYLESSAFGPTKDVEEINHRRATLQTLPIELLVSIFDFLDIKDKTCLSFCNHFLRDIIDTPTWRQHHSDMLSDFHERQDFLRRLVRDYPDHVVCKICSTIHHMTRLAPLAAVMHKLSKCYPRFPQPRIELLALDCIDLYSVYSLDQSHVRLAMERHRYGSQHGIPLNLLSVREVEEDWKSNPQWVRMLSVEPIIIANEVRLRIQNLWLFHSPVEADETIIEGIRLEFCRHHVAISIDVLLCKLRHSNRLRDCPTCSQYQTCNICAIEFQADIRTLTDGRRIVIVTRLLNLGGGDDEPNSTWNLLTSRYWPFDASRRRGIKPVMERGSNEAWRFVEDQGLRSLDEVTCLNISTLCSESYKECFTRLIWERWLSQPYEDNRHWVHQTDTVVDRFWPGSSSSLYDKTGRLKQSIRHSMQDPIADTSRAKPVSEPGVHEVTKPPIYSDSIEAEKDQLYVNSARPMAKPEQQPEPDIPANYHFEYHPGVATDRIEPEHEAKSQKSKESVWRSLKNFFSRK